MRGQVRALALEHPRYGHRRVALKLEEKLKRPVSRRNVQRIMQRERLQIRTRRRKKWAKREPRCAHEITRPDEVWAMDFVTDWSVGVRRKLRILTIVDCATREALAVEVDYSMPSSKVALALAGLKRMGRKPVEIRVDNGPEFVGSPFQIWCRCNGVKVSHIQPGKPMQTGISRASMEGFGMSASMGTTLKTLRMPEKKSGHGDRSKRPAMAVWTSAR